MATTLERQPAQESRFLLNGVSWGFYEACLREIGLRRIRVTYCDGTIEFRRRCEEHERSKCLLGRLIETVTEELNVPILSLGSTTWRKREAGVGLEADECYYIQHEPQVRGRKVIDPPPDLAVEIEISRSEIDRMAVYAALGVPEVWRFDGQTLSIHLLGDDGQYHTADASRNLPTLPPAELTRFLAASNTTDETTWICSFRQWVREHVAPEQERRSTS